MVRTDNSLDANPALILGARGWEHAGWDGVFYPADLPPEWRLAYYANEFQTVLVPEECWRDCTPAQVAGWGADVRPGFSFFLELTCDPARAAAFVDDCAALRERCAALAERMGGLILRFARLPAPRELEALPACLPALHPVSLVLPDGVSPPEASAPLMWSGAAPCWMPGRGLGKSGTGLMTIEDGKYTQRGLRREVESFLKQARGVERAFLFFQGDPPGVQALRDAAVMAELLGHPLAVGG
ncbi:MAG: DUF72 domain-containing protein [Gammaproteobacteria bacterium]